MRQDHTADLSVIQIGLASPEKILAWSFGKVSAQLAGYLSFIQPSVAIFASFLILGEIPSHYFYLGSALVGFGVFLIFRKSSRSTKSNIEI